MSSSTNPPQAPRRALLVVLSMLLLSACGGGTVGQRSDATAGEGLVFPDGPWPWEGGGPALLVVSPQNAEITIEAGKPLPTVQFQATLDDAPVVAKWSLDQGAFGKIDGDGLFTPSGDVAGKVRVTATVGSLQGSATLSVRMLLTQNGATEDNGDPGPGGFGGVGGEGLGPALPADQVTLLEGSGNTGGIELLYPYDETVWPLGLLAPLIQWSALPQGSGDGVLLELSGEGFQYKGTFGRPSALPPGAAFVRHPIPQDVWKAATRSVAGATLTLSVKVLSAGTVYGPLTQTWKVASGQLRGTVYYQSYGTNLAKNYAGALGGDGRFGGATLAIRGSSADPVLVAGGNGDSSACRVCHSVSADGSRMVVQHGNDYTASSAYDLLSGYAESAYPATTNGKLGWIGMTPDGQLGLGNAAPISGGANTVDTALYEMATGAVVAAPGLTDFVTRAGFPMFAPNGGLAAFTFNAGPGNTSTGPGDSTQLVAMDFDQSSRAFSNARLLYDGATETRPGWPAFWPTSEALVFQIELPGNTSGEYFVTRYGARGELRWVDLATAQSHPLHRLNGTNAGVSYLPVGANNHDDDAALNYEPTVSPIASGGYAWVVFVSRRMYGNVATIDPWSSDPREHDLTRTPTTKKLWVAALDLNPQPGSDPSHPAFYLPGQELLAGNSRGFWVVDPCKADGASCEGGDECCNGYCSRSPDSGELVCGQFGGSCANELDKCERDEDCCEFPKFKCINERCARWVVN